MAKGLRSKSKRRFRAIKRATVFAPVENERLQRLAAKQAAAADSINSSTKAITTSSTQQQNPEILKSPAAATEIEMTDSSGRSLGSTIEKISAVTKMDIDAPKGELKRNRKWAKIPRKQKRKIKFKW